MPCTCFKNKISLETLRPSNTFAQVLQEASNAGKNKNIKKHIFVLKPYGVPNLFLNFNGLFSSENNACLFHMIPGKSDPDAVSFESVDYPNYYLSYTGDFQHKNVRFLKICKCPEYATFEMIVDDQQYMFQCKYYADFYLSFISKSLLLTKSQTLHQTKGKIPMNRNMLFKLCKYNSMAKLSIQRSTFQKTEKPTNFLKKSEIPELPKFRLPSYGTPNNRLYNKFLGPKSYMVPNGQMGDRYKSANIYIQQYGIHVDDNDDYNRHSSLLKIIKSNEFVSFELSDKPGVFLYHNNESNNSNKTICFGLKGNICNNGKSMSWKLHEDIYFEGFICLEAIICTIEDDESDSMVFKYTGMFLSYDESSATVVLRKKISESDKWKHLVSWKIDCSKTISVDFNTINNDQYQNTLQIL